MTRFVMGEATFDTPRRRDRAAAQITGEATTRTLRPQSVSSDYSTGLGVADEQLGTVFPAGCWAATVDGGPAPGLRFCYWHPEDAAVDAAAEVFRSWLDANGKIDGYVGTMST